MIKGMSTRLRIESIHHVALPVSDLDRAAKFYREVLGLEEIARPPFSFDGKWYRVTESQQLHLIVHPHSTFRHGKPLDSRDIHFAIRVKSFRAAVEWLRGLGYREEVDRMDPMRMQVTEAAVAGFPQIQICDPDRNVIEINAGEAG
jgi:glyoxylase I family protein